MPRTPVILVHGSYHRPAHYEPLVNRLADVAASITVPDIGMLPLSESTPLVQDIVDRAPSPPVVIGHSFGGAVTGALHGVRHMIFLSAWVLDTTETAADLLAKSATGAPSERATADASSEFTAALRISDDGKTAWINPDSAATLFYADCPPETAAKAVALLRPDTAANFTHPPTSAAWKNTPTLYIKTTQDHTWPPPLATEFATRCATLETLTTSHSPYLSAPDRTAAIIGAYL
ncbi:MAG TPA: alpha/beta hydrolase [Streptosporangiaceae bacterium]